MSRERAMTWAAAEPRAEPRARFRWNNLLWALVFPQPDQRILPTLSGTLLILLSLGIGSAAYNSANNILFITLSLMLACLILSGVLSWFNFRGVHWRLAVAPPLRAGHEAVVGLELANLKTFLPTYGLWFDLAARLVDRGPAAVAESTITGKGIDFRAVLARLDAAEARGRMQLTGRLDPQGTTRLDWMFQPARRGRLNVELVGMGSLFPFGFLRKTLNVAEREEVIVWPAAIDYRWHGAPVEARGPGNERRARPGGGTDLRALRRYAAGDSHRLIHWKASARSQELLVRQFEAEGAEGYDLWLTTDAAVWTQPEQFERLVSFAATLAEDIFRDGRLASVAINDEPPQPVRRVGDLERFLDRLADVTPATGPRSGPTGAAGGSGLRLRFGPDGTHGVAAFVDGIQTATA